MEKYISAEEAVKVINSKDKVFVHGSAATTGSSTKSA